MKTESLVAGEIKFLGQYLGKSVIILVSGKAGVGKTTLSDLLAKEIEKQEYSVYRTSFARSLKKCAIDYMGWDQKKDEKGRNLLQSLGKVGREYSKACWVNNTIYEIYDNQIYTPDFIIIDDFRFVDEFFSIQKGYDHAFSILTIRVNAQNRESLRGTPFYEDISETDLDVFDKFDYTFDNSVNNSNIHAFVNSVVSDIFKNKI